MIDSYAAVAVEEEGRLRRRRAVASLLVFANELERTQRISKASKGLLKGEDTLHLSLYCLYSCGKRFVFVYLYHCKDIQCAIRISSESQTVES